MASTQRERDHFAKLKKQKKDEEMLRESLLPPEQLQREREEVLYMSLLWHEPSKILRYWCRCLAGGEAGRSRPSEKRNADGTNEDF